MRRTGSAQGCDPKETGTLGLFMDADDATSCNVATLVMRSCNRLMQPEGVRCFGEGCSPEA